MTSEASNSAWSSPGAGPCRRRPIRVDQQPAGAVGRQRRHRAKEAKPKRVRSRSSTHSEVGHDVVAALAAKTNTSASVPPEMRFIAAAGVDCGRSGSREDDLVAVAAEQRVVGIVEDPRRARPAPIATASGPEPWAARVAARPLHVARFPPRGTRAPVKPLSAATTSHRSAPARGCLMDAGNGPARNPQRTCHHEHHHHPRRRRRHRPGQRGSAFAPAPRRPSSPARARTSPSPTRARSPSCRAAAAEITAPARTSRSAHGRAGAARRRLHRGRRGLGREPVREAPAPPAPRAERAGLPHPVAGPGAAMALEQRPIEQNRCAFVDRT